MMIQLLSRICLLVGLFWVVLSPISASAENNPLFRSGDSFDRTDTNGDRIMTRDELVRRLRTEFLVYDANRNNEMTFGEIMAKKGGRQVFINLKDPRRQDMLINLRRWFDGLDQNKDRVLTVDEYGAPDFFIFKMADTNQDDQVSWDEYMTRSMIEKTTK